MGLSCRDMEPVLGCYDDGAGGLTTVVVHYEYALDASNIPYIVDTRYTDIAGAIFDVSAGTVVAGACIIGAGFGPDVEWEVLCDDDGAGTITEFMCRTLTTFNSDGTIDTQTVDNFEMDKTTAYTIAGTAVRCTEAACDLPLVGSGGGIWGDPSGIG